MKPFEELFVVELAGSIAGAYAGKLFADFGARVLKVEPPGGDPARTRGESTNGCGSEFAYLNTSKRSVVLDLAAAPGRRALARFLASADVAIESSSPDPLLPATRDLPAEQLVRVGISPFGSTGPYSGLRSNAFTDYAASGHMYLNGEPGREPLAGAGSQAEYAAGTYAFIGAMVALRAREATGRGQDVDVSHMESMASLHQWTTVRYTHGGYVQRRTGNRYDTTHPITIYPCQDGHVAISASSEDQGLRLLAVTGLSHLLADERFATGVARLKNADAFDREIAPWLADRTVDEIVTICQEARVPAGPVPSLLELLEDQHLAVRHFWTLVDGVAGIRFPGPPFRLSRHSGSLKKAPATGDLAVDAVVASVAAELPVSLGAQRNPRPMALAGVRVLDLSRVWAGPIANRILGDFGADVIRVEATWSRGARTVPEAVVRASARFPNNEAGARPWNREGMFNKFNRNKRAVTLNLDAPEGRDVFELLVRQSDVVVENYSPRVMPQLGLGYDRLRELNPRIVYIGMPGFGWTGPLRDYVAFGTTLEPGAGLSSMMGYPDSGPYKSGVAWADPVAGLHAAAAILIALHDREADPERRGQAIELAQLEGMICCIGEHLLDAQVRGSDPSRFGNRHRSFAPQGVYRCAGDDRWLAISVTSDEEWRSLCVVAGLPESWQSFTVAERQRLHDAVDAGLVAWTETMEHREAMERLQDSGVIAVAVLDAKELVEDPHLAARGFFVTITHPDAGTCQFPGMPAHLSQTPATFRLPAPGLGEHNDEVFRGLLGMTAEQTNHLASLGVIASEPLA